MIKSNRIIFINDKVENVFHLLHDEDPIKKGIIKAILDIRKNCQIGEVVKKDSVILKNYKKKYGINNLRVYDLPLSYRLMYTITPNEVEIISVILDWMNHKKYNKINKRKK